MHIYFNLEYRTAYGEDLVLNICRQDRTAVYHMHTDDGVNWQYALNCESAETPTDYYYSVHRNGEEIRHEWNTVCHRLNTDNDKTNVYVVYNRWNDLPDDSYLYTSAFTDCLNRRTHRPQQQRQYAATLRLTVRCPQLTGEQRLALVGSHPLTGAWNTARALPMTAHNTNEWCVDLDAQALGTAPLEVKFVALSDDNSVMWETGMNRTICPPEPTKGKTTVIELDQAFMPLHNKRVAGTLIPVFSLRTKGSFGVGDFGDLCTMIDYTAASNQRVLQILPINDTTYTHTWTDSYPYSCISVFALHPLYLDLRQLPRLNNAGQRAKMEALQQELNALPQIDYERVMDAKMTYLRLLFKQEKDKALQSSDFHSFFADSRQWLVPYARYSMLAEQYGTRCFTEWPAHNTWDEGERNVLSQPGTQAWNEVVFWYYVQYVLHLQMEAAHRHAIRRGVVLKGDIPIGVARYGCDVWTEPQYFNLDGQAGAPPDGFSVNGQNWGFPTYNWQEMLKDGCKWWERRFRNMAKYFDAYRIDHVLGFFRIWEIPISSVHGLLGQFSPSIAMSRAEIESYGLPFLEEHFTTPFISNWILDRVFGERADEVKRKYLKHRHDDIWQLLPEYDTQRKIEAAFANDSTTEGQNLRDGLYALVSNVLFVRDKQQPDHYHPRISAQYSFTYEALWDCDKERFNRLYNDYFYRRNNQYWYSEAMKKLPRLVEATRMLVCAEDLGMVPDCVDWVMNRLRILSLEVQSMPKNPRVRFSYLQSAPYRSVCTFSSHDMPTLRQWWDEDAERTRDYYNTMLYHPGEAPHPLPGTVAGEVIRQQLDSPSMLCVLSWQDWMAMDERLRLPDADAERINIPANPRHYWRYRMHMNIEDLMNEKQFIGRMKQLIRDSGR